MSAAFAAGAAGALSPAREKELVHLIRQDCGACHGMTMKGGLGSPLLPETLAGKDDDALKGIIMDGIHGTPMPPWRPLLTEGEVAWIVKKLKEGLP
ncbi:MAG: cytochrome c [Alphaproteobacteria bacterium]|nr:cytochrome c [Alphaproteobacteria bacterium]